MTDEKLCLFWTTRCMYIHALKNDVSYNIVLFLFEVCMLEVVSDENLLQIQINHVEKPPCAIFRANWTTNCVRHRIAIFAL